jgi:hypothetical protein
LFLSGLAPSTEVLIFDHNGPIEALPCGASLAPSGASNEEDREFVEDQTLWKRRNYGGMAKLFWSKLTETSKGHGREVREQSEGTDLESYSLRRIVDEAPAIAEVDAGIVDAGTDSRATCWTFRLIREELEWQRLRERRKE